MSRGRKRRKAAALAGGGTAVSSPVLLPSWDACHPREWIPDLDNAHLMEAARGLSSIAVPLHAPPCPGRTPA